MEFFHQNGDDKGKCRPKWAVLSVDGGGIKGIIPAVILAQLEYVLRKEVAEWRRAVKEDTNPDPLLAYRREFVEKVDDDNTRAATTKLKSSSPKTKPVVKTMLKSWEPETMELSDFFNLMSGTSTGALIVGGLANPQPATHNDERIGKALQAWQLYAEEGESIFNPHKKSRKGCWGIPWCGLIR